MGKLTDRQIAVLSLPLSVGSPRLSGLQKRGVALNMYFGGVSQILKDIRSSQVILFLVESALLYIFCTIFPHKLSFCLYTFESYIFVSAMIL